MKILFTKTNSPYANLATEEYLFNSNKYRPPIIFLWQNQNTIVVGKNQNTFAEINLINAQQDDVNIVRRNTGGGTVYQDLGNLCFSLLISNNNESSVEVFEKSLQPILDLLRNLGLNANFKGRNDLEIDGAKISGNAQMKNSHKILSHGTLLFDVDLAKINKYLNVNPVKMESKKISSVKARVTNIKPLLKETISIEDFIKMIAKQYMQADVEKLVLDQGDLKAIEKLTNEKFKSWDWNFGHNETFNSIKTEYFPGIGLIEVGMNVEKGIIKTIDIFGDFLGTIGTYEITQKLKNKKYDRETIKIELQKIKNLNEIFGAEIAIDTLLNLILK